MKRISIQQAKRIFAIGEKSIYLIARKMMIGTPWRIEFELTPKSIKEYKENAERYRDMKSDLWKGNINKTAWALMYNSWSFYNTNYEMGYYAHFYTL